MKLVHGNVVRIKIAINKVVEAGEEFRYDYGRVATSKFQIWGQMQIYLKCYKINGNHG